MLQMTKEKLYSYTAENIQELWGRAAEMVAYRKALARRARRKSSAYQVMGDGKEPRIIAPFESEILGIGQGYLGGKPPVYKVDTKIDDTESDIRMCREYKQAIDGICDANDCQALHLDLVGDFLETTAAYLYIYEEEGTNQIVHARFDPLCTVGIWDYGVPKKLIGVLRRWVEDGEKEVLELITAESRTAYSDMGSGWSVTDTETLLWGDVPVVAFEKEGATAIFEPAITLIDAFEQLSNNIRSMTQYNDEAKLAVKGYSAANQYGVSAEEDRRREEEERKFLDAMVLFIDLDGDISWLLKNVDYGGILEVMQTLHQLIMFCVSSPDTIDTTFTAAESSLALRLKMFPFELRVAQTQAVFRKGYMRQIELETNRMNLKSRGFDVSRVSVELPVNVPSDTERGVSIANTMYNGGLFSKKTSISKSGIDVDPDQEIKQRQLEDEAEYDRLMQRQEGNPENDEGRAEPE